MRIGIDARSVNERMCGVSRTSLSLLKALLSLDKSNSYMIYINNLIDEKLFPVQNNITLKIAGYRRYHPCERIFSKRIAADHLDIFHSLHAALPFLFKAKVGKVVTIPDIFAAKYPWFFEKHGLALKHLLRKYFNFIIRRSIEKSDIIVAISEYTKNQIIEYFHADMQKIRVISCGFDQNLFRPLDKDESIKGVEMIKREFLLSSPFALFVGNFKKYKNVEGVFAGFAAYCRRNPGTSLQLAVGSNERKGVEKTAVLIKKYKLDGKVRFLGYLESEKLRALYGLAEMLLFPSYLEGFGLPVLEAMAVGTPVITSSSSALPEVAGEAALFVNPAVPEELADKIGLLLNDRSLRQRLIKAGRERIKNFSWEKSAQKYLEVYEAVFREVKKR